MVWLGSLFSLLCAAGNGKYAVSAIPSSLIKNANIVKRLEEETFSLRNAGEAVYRRKYVYTILNANGDRFAGFQENYYKFRDFRWVEGTLYDAAGNELRRLKKKDVMDRSGVSGDNLMDDNRVKEHNFYHRSYPYTIEYEYEIKYNGTMFYPRWQPQEAEKIAVEESRFIFSCPEDYTFRYKAYQFSGEPVITKEKNTRVYTWQLSNLPAILREPYSPAIKNIAPLVLFGPALFEMQDYKGNMQSWQDLGKFIYALKEGRDELPADIKARVHQLTDNLNDPALKIRTLYEYLQKNTRYISIQLGIGGWQPFDAKFVAAKKYGDCKALTNYMAALLKEAGIPSRYAVIYAGRGQEHIFDDFPSSQFNHVVLCVPFQHDTIWLECTSATAAAGYMGGFTGNRYALLVDEQGGKLVRTPAYGIDDNYQVRHVKARLDEEATLSIRSSSLYGGLQQDQLSGLINGLTKEKVKEYLHEEMDFATYEINAFNYTEKKERVPSISEELDITVSNYATITGKRLFIVPNVMTRSYRRPAADEDRKYPVELGMAYRDIDSVEISLPAGYGVETLPSPVSLNTRFGKYSAAVRIENDKLYYYRSMEGYSGSFPASDYTELVRFYEAIYKADRSKVVLVKK